MNVCIDVLYQERGGGWWGRVQFWIHFRGGGGGPKLNFKPCQRQKEGITLHFENSSGGGDMYTT